MLSNSRLRAPAVSHQCLDLEKLSRSQPDQQALTGLLSRQLERADEVLAERFWEGVDIADLVAARAWSVEQILLRAWRHVESLQGAPSLVAMGGFGRGELHPHSDVDLLLLSARESLPQEVEAAIQDWLNLLWDAGLAPSHSVRSAESCVIDAREDVQFTTNLMEARLLAGSGAVLEQVKQATQPDHIWPADDFFRAKTDEQNLRHASFNDSAYRLEPQIKEGPGGLRDIQTIEWVARRHFRVRTLFGLVEHGFLTTDEAQQLTAARDWLWRVRYALHLLSGRGEERLLFEWQRQIAERLHYPGEANQAVENFMQDHFKVVGRVERLNERLLQLFREELLAGSDHPPRVIDDAFQIRDGYLEARRDDIFLHSPSNLIRLFQVLASHPDVRAVRASTQRLLRQHLYLVDEAFNSEPAHNRLFLEILQQPEGVYSALNRMNRYGFLARFIPEFENIVGRMQFDLFHIYTVDQHILFVLRNLRRFALDRKCDQHPHAAETFRRIDRPELLYLAALFHDIAKGRDGDHSELGRDDARRFCQRLGLDAGSVSLVAWLVEQHLLMSQTAQRRDISDPEVVQAFAEKIGDTRRLDYLYLLTMADITATSPTLWNSWKDSLLWDLYLASGHALRRGLARPKAREDHIRETRSAAFSHLIRCGYPAREVARLWQQFTDNAFLRLNESQLVWMTEERLAQSEDVLVRSRDLDDRGATELLIIAPDAEGVFAAITRVLDHLRLNILSARVMTTKEDRAVDLFQVQDANGEMLSADDQQRVLQRLRQSLSGNATEHTRFRLPRRLRAFHRAPEIVFEPHPGTELTFMTLECSDRPGLLSSVAQLLLQNNVVVHDARVATFGDRVEDTFLLSDTQGQALDEKTRDQLASAIQNHFSQETP